MLAAVVQCSCQKDTLGVLLDALSVLAGNVTVWVGVYAIPAWTAGRDDLLGDRINIAIARGTLRGVLPTLGVFFNGIQNLP